MSYRLVPFFWMSWWVEYRIIAGHPHLKGYPMVQLRQAVCVADLASYSLLAACVLLYWRMGW